MDALAQAETGDGRWVNAARASLHGDVEIDDAWVGGERPGIRGSRQLKGRKAETVLVAGRNGARPRIVCAIRDPDFKQATMLAFVRQHVLPGSTIYTDGLKSYGGVAGLGRARRRDPTTHEDGAA